MLSRKEFNEAVQLHSDSLFRYMLKLVRDRDMADNWVQEAYTVLWEKRENIESSKVKSFLYTTAYRKMIDSYRREIRFADFASGATQETKTAQPDYSKRQLLELAFSRVEAKYKSLILLRDYEGYDYSSIAEISGLSLSSVKVNIFRGRQKLKEILTQLMTEPEVKHG